MINIDLKCLLLAFVAGMGCSLHAGLPLESAGVRFGFPANEDMNFRQAEVFVDFKLPWRTEISTNWMVQTRFDLSAGWLAKNRSDAFITTAGPSVVLSRRNCPVTLDLGFNPTYLSRYVFPARNFGIPFQFTSHAGLDWNVSSHLRLGYRFQHMSSGGLGSPNPGLNLNMFTVSCRF